MSGSKKAGLAHPVTFTDHVDEPLPFIKVRDLLNHKPEAFKPDSSVLTISVDVMAVAGGSAATIDSDTNIFYESELLAIVHRFKTKSSGLVATKVWGWKGKKAQMGEREERKIKDLARHHGTSMVCQYLASIIYLIFFELKTSPQIFVPQCQEPDELIHVLGGQIAIRQVSLTLYPLYQTADSFQGSRSHWSAENTTMHVVRSRQGYVIIDEVDLVSIRLP